MDALMQRKTAVRQVPTGDLTSQVLRLSRQNALLRKEVARLQVFRSMAYRDPLTGLWNRRYFEERLKEEFSRSQRAGSSRRFSVLVVDINDFKATNDRHGHPMGDIILKWVGDFLITHLRTHDVPCRTGGDEFAVLLPDVSAEDCARLVARLREQLGVANAGRDITVGLSLGTASWPDVGSSCEDIISFADEAMYADKRLQKEQAGPAAIEKASRRRKAEEGPGTAKVGRVVGVTRASKKGAEAAFLAPHRTPVPVA
jgi:diguanylate cyclase (GGDEF)-like protein